MKRRPLGSEQVSAIGLGAMPLSVEGRPDRETAFATIRAAIETGITLIDSADAYHLGGQPEVGHNEELLAEALQALGRDAQHVIVATKGGSLRPAPGPHWERNGSPSHLKSAARASARRLRVDAIDLYQLHKPDPEVPYAESVGALSDLLDEGVIKQAGISNATIEHVDIAHEVLGDRLVSVQNRYSSDAQDDEILARCESLGIAFLAWGPLGGAGAASTLATRYPILQPIADAHGVSAAAIVIAWELTTSPQLLPLSGSRRPATIRDSGSAALIELTVGEMSVLDSAFRR